MKKVSELSGALLDHWVAQAEGLARIPGQPSGYFYWTDQHGHEASGFYAPSTLWEIGGPIIERDQICLDPPHGASALPIGMANYYGGPIVGWKLPGHWSATVSAATRTWSDVVGGRVGRGTGETALIAAMRAKVASHYGDEVPTLLLEASHV